MIVPATALVVACIGGTISAAELDPPEFTVTVLSQAIVPAVALLAATASSPIDLDIAHAAYEAQATGYPVVTANSASYGALGISVDLEPLPQSKLMR